MKKNNEEITLTAQSTEVKNASIALNGHYIKELLLDNKNSPASFMKQNTNPKIEIAVNLNARDLGNDTYEVALVVKTKATSMDEGSLGLFEVKLVYAGLFILKDVVSDEQKEEILMAYCPQVLLPYTRRILSDVTRDGGFQPIMLEYLDFASLHNQRKSEQMAKAS